MSEPLLNAQPSCPNGQGVQTANGPRKTRRLSTTTSKTRRATPSDRAFENIYFDGRHYWHPHPTVHWQRLNVGGVVRLLRVDYGLTGARLNGGPSQIDCVLCRVQMEHRICPVSRREREHSFRPHIIPKALRDKNVGGLGAIRNRPPEGDGMLGTDSQRRDTGNGGPCQRAVSKRGRR